VSAGRAPRFISALIVGALGIVGCGGSSKGSDTTVAAAPTTVPMPAAGKTLTTGQAVRLSRVFFNNWDKGGATVTVEVPYGLQSSVRIDAEVDWKQHRGQGTITTVFADGRADEVQPLWWYLPNDLANGSIVTTLAGLPEAMALRNHPGVKYIGRPIAEQSPLDITVRFLDRMMSDRAENPVLLRQADTGYLGAETVGGVACDHIRFGDKGTQYWIGTGDGMLRQVSARLSGLPNPTVFRLSGWGTRTIEAPGATEVVDSRAIPELYAELTSRSAAAVTTSTTTPAASPSS
jgi:hypothetical protein